MAAGLGFKTFNTGDVLSAADVNGYLMQGILVFASGTARDAAITSPEEGQFAFLKDTNVTTYYTGSAWANVDTTGMTNPMTTTGDVIYSSSGSTPARLGIGTAGQVLQVNSGATAPEWATPAGGGGLTFIKSQTIGSAVSSVQVTGAFSSTYDNYLITVNGGVGSGDLNLRLTLGSTTAGYYSVGYYIFYNSATLTSYKDENIAFIGCGVGSTNTLMSQVIVQNPNLAKRSIFITESVGGSSSLNINSNRGFLDDATQYTAFTITASTGTMTGGTVRVYGYQNS
jgi:hypothetical protein